MSARHVVDSSGWLEYFADSPRAKHFAATIEQSDALVVPVVTVFEVFRRVLRERGETAALTAASAMQHGEIVDLDMALALDAARLDLPLADSLIYATARRYDATLWTQDEDFKTLPGVKYFPVK